MALAQFGFAYLGASSLLLALSDALDRRPVESMLTLRAWIVLSSETCAGWNGHLLLTQDHRLRRTSCYSSNKQSLNVPLF